MSAYRFCRTDDIALLVDALNHCWAPHAPGEPPMTPVAFKRLIRDLQVWCSSCMVAFSGSEPIGVLIGAKRASGTLIHTIAVHPDHLRQGHGRHLLASLGSKLAILGPPRLVAEVPETLVPACELFRTSGYEEEALLTDYVWEERPHSPAPLPGRGVYIVERSASDRGLDDDASGDEAPGVGGRFVIPVTVDDLAANDLLDGANSQACWARSIETLTARKADIAGLAVASDERIEAYVVHANDEIVSLRCFVDDDGARLRQLLAQVQARGADVVKFPKVHPSEASKESMATLGFRADATYVRYAATARPD